MYQQSIGFNPSSLLSGLSPNASAFSRGKAMQSAASLGLDREKANQESATQQMQADSQYRQGFARNAAQRAQNASQERLGAGQLQARRAVFNTNLGFDYAGANRRNALQYQQSVLNGLARDF